MAEQPGKEIESQANGRIEGVSNGLCEHLRACEQCVYFCEHEQLSNFSCEQRALEKNTDGEQRALRVLRKFSASRNLSFINCAK